MIAPLILPEGADIDVLSSPPATTVKGRALRGGMVLLDDLGCPAAVVDHRSGSSPRGGVVRVLIHVDRARPGPDLRWQVRRMTPSATTTHHNQEETPTMTVNEYWNDAERRSHPIGCHCAPNGRHCEQAQAVAEERAERREMAGRYPCGEFAPHVPCAECRRAWRRDPEAGW